MYDYSRLLGKLRELNKTQAELAAAIGITEVALNRKLKGASQFKQCEMRKTLAFLGESIENVAYYFFYKKTCENAS